MAKALFISSTKGIPDPEGAAILLESLDKITDNKSLEIDTQHLRKQGVALRARMEKIIQSLRGQQTATASRRSTGCGSHQGWSDVRINIATTDVEIQVVL